VCNALLESPLNFPSTKKVSKNPHQIGITVVCPKSQNSIYGTHNPLGVKGLTIILRKFWYQKQHAQVKSK
jgi:hypothetical protein